MRRPLPPLNALRAFECAARHRSFRKAAAELHVTPAAVSHQVKSLEDILGVQLFRRVTRGLELTDQARASLVRLSAGFDALAGAVELLRSSPERTQVRVAAPPSLAGKWLSPRLAAFIAAHADADVRLDASERYIDARHPGDAVAEIADAEDAPDLVIRFGTGGYPGARVDKLFEVRATPLCSPALLEGEHPLKNPDDLRHHVLLHDDTLTAEEGGADWDAWLTAAGVEGLDTRRGPHFNQASVGLEAAADGAGVILTYPALAASEVARGRLVAPFDLSLPVTAAYYAVTRTAEPPALVVAFRDWLLAESARDLEAG